MKERNIKVSLEKAKEWYESDNPTLKELALQAFTKKELEHVIYEDDILPQCIKFNDTSIYSNSYRFSNLIKMYNVERCLNKDWKPKSTDYNNYIEVNGDSILIVQGKGVKSPFTFPTFEKAQEFIDIVGVETIRNAYGN